MTVLNADSQSRPLTGTRRAGTDRAGQGRGRGRRPWKAFLVALLRAMSVWTA